MTVTTSTTTTTPTTTRPRRTAKPAPEVPAQVRTEPVGGVLDVKDNSAYIRKGGYLPGQKDVLVPLALVRQHGLRSGDLVRGGAANGRLASIETVNGLPPGQPRPDFAKLVPIYPEERLRLETTPAVLSTRVIDLLAPIGKGQRGLLVAPPKAGKTMILQAVANAITANHPECHLMILLIDERPEEVTDMRQSTQAEIVASTFDRPAQDHITVAELAIERAKRLVELGQDVVVLIDSITRLARAYNAAMPGGGRILTGGMDARAVQPPKRILGAARNVEHGGSLTILATALVENGSKMDEHLFEEFKSTGNMELRLSRALAERRVFPAVDVTASGTRKEELLMDRDERSLIWTLRRAVHAPEAFEPFLAKLKATGSNAELLLGLRSAGAGNDASADSR